MPTPHIHEKEIIAWAQGMQIEYEDCGWHDCTEHPTWDLNTRYRVKPAAPKWPQTTMGAVALIQAYQDGAKKGEALICAANAVIAHECRTGALVPADKVREIEAKARAEGIKEGRSKEQDLLRQQVDFGAGYGRAAHCGAQAFSPSIFEIQRMQHADAVARGLTK